MDDRPLRRDKSKRARSNPVVERRLHDRGLAVEGHGGPRRRGLDPKLLGLEDVQLLVGLAPDERAQGDAGEVSPSEAWNYGDTRLFPYLICPASAPFRLSPPFRR